MLLFQHRNAHHSNLCTALVIVMCIVITVLSNFDTFVAENNPKLVPSMINCVF